MQKFEFMAMDYVSPPPPFLSFPFSSLLSLEFDLRAVVDLMRWVRECVVRTEWGMVKGGRFELK
jgi:hypothetical protein